MEARNELLCDPIPLFSKVILVLKLGQSIYLTCYTAISSLTTVFKLCAVQVRSLCILQQLLHLSVTEEINQKTRSGNSSTSHSTILREICRENAITGSQILGLNFFHLLNGLLKLTQCLRSSLVWNFTYCRLVVRYRLFGRTYRS